MAETVNSTNMNLPVPQVGIDPGPQWGEDLNSCLTLIDAHDHSTGSGVRITPDGMNINEDLSFQTTSSITNLYTANFTSQVAALTGTNFLSFIGGNLYVNDSSGNQIPITSGGGVAGSPGSIGSLTSPAAATYTAGSKLFTWTADTAKSAAMDNGAVTIRETNVASAKGITLQSPTGLGADYSLTFLTGLPVSTQLINVSSSGAMGNITYDAVGQAMTSTGANAIAASRTRATGTTVAAGGVAVSSAISFTTSSTSFVDITNATVTITTSGRPIFIGLSGNGLGADAYIGGSSTSGVSAIEIAFRLYRDASVLNTFRIDNILTATNWQELRIPPGAIVMIEAQAAGTYVYKLQGAIGVAGSGRQLEITGCRLIAYEL